MGNFSEKYDLNKAKLLKQLIEKSYKRGNFTLSSGKKSSHYLNCKPVSLNGVGLNLISDLFLELKDSRSKAVAGLTLGADPIVCLLYTSPSPRDAHKSRMPSSA